MKLRKLAGLIVVFVVSLFLLAGCSSPEKTGGYPTGIKKKRVNYSAYNTQLRVSNSGRIKEPTPKHYRVPKKRKKHLVK